MPTELEQCPERDQLVDYLLGRLPSEDSSFCEAHLAECDPCEQTIRSLDVSDTLSELAQNGLGKTEKLAEEESAVLKQLVGDIAQWSQPATANKAAAFEAPRDSDLVDRAAEVQHFFEDGTEPEDIGKVGKYRIVELLGAGSSGVVYRAIDTQLGRHVAVKFLRPSLGVVARQRFLTEAQAAAVINHPNVVQIFEVGMEDKLAFIAMQCLPGQTLEQFLKKRGALGNDGTRKIGKQIAAGLAAAHQAGIVHRDIKPANIWICSKTENATILDFGLARILDEDPQLTCTGLIAGTPCFMSPEQTRGRDIDRRSDFFSLGCLLYQCLTGVLPFKSENVLATLQSVQMLTPEAPIQLDPGVDPGLSSLVMTLLEKSPHNRPSQTEDVSAAFDLPVSDWNFAPAQTCQPINSNAKNRVATSQPTRWWPGVFAAVAIGLVSFGSFFLPQIIRIATNKGQIVIESNDPDVQIEVLQGGEQIDIIDLKTEQKLSVVSGEYQIRPMGDQNEITIDKEKLTIRRGENEIVRVTRNESESEAKAESELAIAAKPDTQRKGGTYLLDAGDILGVFVENVLGKFGEAPPVQVPLPGSGLPPAIGYPIVVREDGTISLPLIEKISVRGMSIEDAEKAVEKAYRTGEEPILIGQARIIVTLSRKRGYKPPVAANQLGQLAMAGAQLEAAEAEYGENHPFVTQLRTKLLRLISEDDPASNKEGADDQSANVSASDDLSVEEQPTFDGKTYAEHYKVAKYERNPDLAWPALRGIVELYSEENKTQTVQACIEIFRRTDGEVTRAVHMALRRIATIVDSEALSGMLFSEVKSGTSGSQDSMYSLLLRYVDDRKREQIFGLRTEELVKAIIESSNGGKMGSFQGAKLLYHIHEFTKLDMRFVEGIETTLLDAIRKAPSRPEAYDILFAMNILDNSPEVIEAVFDATATVKQPDSSSLAFTNLVFKKLAELSPDQLEDFVPKFQAHPVYLGVKRGNLKNDDVEPVFGLIAAFGEHAKVFKDDFKRFDQWKLEDPAYLKARAAVFGEQEPAGN